MATETNNNPTSEVATVATTDTASLDTGEVNWGDLASHDDDFEAAPAEPADTAALQQTPDSVTPSEPQVAQQSVPQEAAPQVQSPVAQDQSSVPQQQQDVSAPQAMTYEQQMQALADSYQISEEQALGIMTDPAKVLPSMAATIHARVMQEVFSALPQHIIGMVQQQQQFAARETEAKNEFFTAWPELKGHEDAVMRVGQMFRAANPTADKKTSVEKIGQMVMMSLGIQRSNAPQAPAQNSPQMQPPYQPAMGGGSGNNPPQTPSLWDMMATPDD